MSISEQPSLPSKSATPAKMKQRSTERSSACSTCGKTFARTDTLSRHEKSHLATEDRGPVHRVTNGTFRACHSCAQARSRCSGGSPCGRCKIRSLSCAYPNKRRKGTDEAEGFDVMKQKSVTYRRRSEPQKSSLPQSQQRFPTQFQEIVFSQTPKSSVSGKRRPEVVQTESEMQVDSAMPIQVLTQLDRQHSNTNYSPTFRQPVIGIQQHQSHLQQDTHTIPQVAAPNTQQEFYNGNTQMEDFSNPFTVKSTEYDFENTYDDSMSLNWIPPSTYPSPLADMDEDFSFLLRSLSDTISLETCFDGMQYDAQILPLSNRDNQAEMSMLRSIPERKAANSLLRLVQSPISSTSDNQSTVLSYQSDGRFVESKSKNRGSLHNQEIFTRSRDFFGVSSFPDTTGIVYQTTSLPHHICSDDQYSAIRNAFENMYMSDTRSNQFEFSVSPNLATVNMCIDLYFEHFHSTFPLLHFPTLNNRGTNWMVLLAVAAVGSNFTSGSTSLELRIAFQELLRKLIAQRSYLGQADLQDFQIIQARILNLVCLMQSYQNQVKAAAPQFHADLSRWCLESGILQMASLDEQLEENMSQERRTQAWHKWIIQESTRRAGYFVWLLDCSSGYLCNARPLCNMDDARAPLPCSEALWNASTANEWYKLKLGSSTMPSLCTAMEDMYSKKEVPPGISDISHILLVHALYSRTWEVGTQIKQPLSEWKATGNARGFLNTPSKDNFWLPLYPLYANWRNSACDCLDTLQWHASGIVAQAAGAEHHVVLHLHLARIILLTPFQEIQDLLFFLINYDVGEDSKATFYVHDGSYQRRNLAKLPQIRKITSRWLREDQHKARLAIIHSGSVFWHVRRYSKKSFYEPLAIYLASIVLWTYGSYKSAALEREAANDNNPADTADQIVFHDKNIQPTRVELAARSFRSLRSKSSNSVTPDRRLDSTSPVGDIINIHHQPSNQNLIDPSELSETESGAAYDEEEDDEEDDQPTFIHLDRPCDDEIVQHFVRDGHNMSGYMSNVGDICKTPHKVLIEGAKLLRGKLGAWGVSREYHDILMKLAARGKERWR